MREAKTAYKASNQSQILKYLFISIIRLIQLIKGVVRAHAADSGATDDVGGHQIYQHDEHTGCRRIAF